MNVSENNNFFRESFRGFNKDDVAEYIAKLSKDYAANEEKYKEHIAKLTAEIKAKNEELITYAPEPADRFELSEIEDGYKSEIGKLTGELGEKDGTIGVLQLQIETLKRECVDLEKEAASLRTGAQKEDSETVNQLSFQLAGAESEKMYLFNLIKKFISILEIESAKGKNLDFAANISDIAPKSVISQEAESKLAELVEIKKQAGELGAINAGLKEKIAALEAEMLEFKTKPSESEGPIVLSDEQKMYESITADLGGIIYSAKKTAEEITAKAKADAENILDQAKFEAESTVAGASVKRDAVIEENKKNMKEFKGKYEFIKKVHADMLQKYEEISGDYASRLSEIRDTINILYDSLDEAYFSEK
ncbi:MAG: DivIVA domain-containing protein [Oscillospiraceae bacterium]|nr:DivIVA domain-containing protein [Oscillospiraceae bacterium]